MIALGLSVADQRLFNLSLITGYNVKVTIQILDLAHRRIHDVSEMLLDGQVDHSWAEVVAYSTSMTLLDPDNLTGFDTASPSDNALYADRMIRVVYSVWSEMLPRWVDVPLFCGPVSKVKRDDAILSVEAQGKESLLIPPTLPLVARNYKKGTRLTTLIRDVAGTVAGEHPDKFDLPNWTTAISQAYGLGPEFDMWQFMRLRVGSRSVRHLYYDGRGYLKLRTTPHNPNFTFTEAHLTSVPQLDYNHTDIRNTVIVRGGTPKGKPQLRRTRNLPDSNPSSSLRLGRNGKRRYITEIVEDDTLMTQADVNEKADQVIDSISLTNVGFQFDSLPIPHIEPGDVFDLQTRDVSIQLRMSDFSIPLKVGSPQSNGTVRKLSANRARLRRR